MDEKQLKAVFDKVVKLSVNLLTLKPLFKRWFSFNGLITTWIVINIYYVGRGIFNLFDWDYMELKSGDPIWFINKFVYILSLIVTIGVLFYLRGIYKHYDTGRTKQRLDLAKSLGVLDSSEYDIKLLNSKKVEYVKEVRNMHNSGIFDKIKTTELIEMAEQHYCRKISEIAIIQAFESGVLTKGEKNDKLKLLQPFRGAELSLDDDTNPPPPAS